jgi:hypothetical protein
MNDAGRDWKVRSRVGKKTAAVILSGWKSESSSSNHYQLIEHGLLNTNFCIDGLRGTIDLDVITAFR